MAKILLNKSMCAEIVFMEMLSRSKGNFQAEHNQFVGRQKKRLQRNFCENLREMAKHLNKSVTLDFA